MARKVEPLPIGLDLHTLSEKVRGATKRTVREQLCAQRRDLSLARLGTAFQSRRLAVHAEFDYSFTSLDPRAKGVALRLRTRGALCELLRQHRGDSRYWSPLVANSTDQSTRRASHSIPPLSLRGANVAFWGRVATCAFSLAPRGFGLDTHRTACGRFCRCALHPS